MKKALIFLLTLQLSWLCEAQIYNTAPNGDTWYKVKTRKQHLCSITARGEYAEHRAVVYLISGIWNTAEVTIVSEYNYDHKTIDILYGYVGSASDKYLAIKTSPLTAGFVNGFTITEIENSNVQIELEEISDPNTVTPILPQSTLHVDEHSKKVGVGTVLPLEKFHVVGSSRFNGTVDVAGTIRAEEVKVETGWADFVFHEDYNLKSLSEVSTYIQENHHLPGIPTAAEVAENGIKLGEMNAKLLEKVEELTLYLIEQNEKIEKQQKEIEILRNENKKQNELIRELSNL